MKRTLSILLGLALVGSVFGQESLSQLTMTISTTGPDYYKDGTQVLDGETYLLVYLKTNALFKGVLMNGSLVDSANNVIAATAQAKNGSCEFKALQFPPSLYPSSGRWVIVLLDTRKANGTVGGFVVNSGASAAVSGSHVTSYAVNDLLASSGNNGTLTSTVIAPAASGTPAPVITSIKQQGASVKVSINNLIQGNNYYLQEVTAIGKNSWVATPVVNPIPCIDSAATLSINVPAAATNQNSRFFRIVTPLP